LLLESEEKRTNGPHRKMKYFFERLTNGENRGFTLQEVLDKLNLL